eukprot:5651871-Pleurochrysis_carterae.AAC.1
MRERQAELDRQLAATQQLQRELMEAKAQMQQYAASAAQGNSLPTCPPGRADTARPPRHPSELRAAGTGARLHRTPALSDEPWLEHEEGN